MEKTLLEQYRPIAEQVVQTAREMITKGLAYGVAGNVSARLPDNRGLLITPSGKNYGKLTAEDLCFVDWQGQVLEGSPRPSSELAIHTATYQARPDCRGVVHTHSTFACALAVTRTAIPVFIDELMYVTGGPVRVAEYGFPGSPELAQNLVGALTDVQAALMANHGVIGLGDDLAEALHVCEVVEKISEVYINALKVGPIFELEGWVIERQRKAFLAKKARQRGQ
ncbi:MAG: class II aldolase/adducin family protein [Chloroflexi bacterium]|nr:class II aldolase/adducin family protein [Chloroflexota bacterium]OJV92765.1 MAG: hypothetical protein BGO39_29825 [Chloroflexi bacterium 54-19]